LYQQIASEVARRIRTGALPAGFRLPTTRALANELKTHRNTAVRAYNELTSAGFIVSTVGRGTFVAQVLPAPRETKGDLEPREGALPWATLVSRASGADPLRRADRFARLPTGPEMINLGGLQPPPELRPDVALRRCVDHVLQTRGAAALGYAPRAGLPQLRELIARDLCADGVPATAEEVVITTGSQQALDLLVRALVDPGDSFLVDEATYAGVVNILASAGARTVGVPGDDDGPDPAALNRLVASGAKGFYLMPNCGNPTARCVSAPRRARLVEWSREAGVPLIEDDYGADLELDDVPLPPALRALDRQVIYVGTFSKKLLPALRVGFLVCPAELAPHLLPLKHAMDLGTSVLLQYALAEFIDRGYLRAHLARIRPVYRERRDALLRGLAEHLPPEIRWRRPTTGLLVWLRLPPSINPEAAFEAARREGVMVTPGVLNSASGQGEGGLRVTFCAEPPERLAEAARKLGIALRKCIAMGPRTASVELV
jgi:DNA-binding transcriptional MocR family regulator